MLEQLFLHHAKPLYRYLLRKTKLPALAADLVQETFLRMAERVDLEKLERSSSYLHRIANNLLLDHQRRHDVSRTDSQPLEYFDDIEDHAAPNPEARALDTIELERVAALLASLPQRTRDVFILCRLEGMSYREAASYLEISVTSVQNHMSIAMTKVGRLLDTKPDRP